MDKDLIYFYIHKFFTRFTLTTFFAFGVIVIYDLTQNLLLTLSYYFVHYIFIILIKTVFLKEFMGVINFLKFKLSMFFGLILYGSSFLLIFYLPKEILLNNYILFSVALISAIGANLYFVPSDVIRLSIIGKSSKPGFFSALFFTNSIFAGLISGLLALYLNKINSISVLFLFAGLSFMLSFLFLFKVNIVNKKYNSSFLKYMKTISFKSHLACMELNHELYNIALPLVILSLFGSITKSIFIVAISSIGTIIFVQINGKLKDLNNNFMLYFAGIGLVLGWSTYYFISSEINFILVGIIVSSLYKLIQSNFEARLGRKMANGEAFDKNLAYDFSKLFGRIIIILILILIVLNYGYVPKEILVIGSIFIIPKLLFTIKEFDKLEN